VDAVHLAASRTRLTEYRSWAEELGCGLELYAFSEPAVLSGDWQAVVAEHQAALAGFRGGLGLHGAFFDMASGSIDPAIVTVTRQRYQQSMEIAAALGAKTVVFHLNYLPYIKSESYRTGWTARQIAFWQEMAEVAESAGITVHLENMWEDDPDLLAAVAAGVDHPAVRLCLDVAHTVLYSETPLSTWMDALSPWLRSVHLNNHDGQLDRHWALSQGVIEYRSVVRHLRQLQPAPIFVLEMTSEERVKRSLPFFNLPGYDNPRKSDS
jgi:sugar phosphate isomerase/epimerase